MNKLFLIIIAIFGLVNMSYANEFGLKASEIASKYTYIRESNNNNRGPEIDKWLSYCGVPLGNPYCMATVVWVYHETALSENKKDVIPKYARVATFNKWANNNSLKVKVISTKQLLWGTSTIKPGQAIIWKHGKSGLKDNITDWNGHTGLVVMELPNKKLKTVEGNTKPSDKGDQTGRVIGDTKYGNDGVYFRVRSIARDSSFPIINLIEVR